MPEFVCSCCEYLIHDGLDLGLMCTDDRRGWIVCTVYLHKSSVGWLLVAGLLDAIDCLQPAVYVECSNYWCGGGC